MRNILRNLWINKLKLIPLIFSVIAFNLIFFTLKSKLVGDCNYFQILSSIRTDIIMISGILTGLIIAYLSSKVLQIRSEKIARLPELTELTQKVHRFRSILNVLIHSNIWVKGLSSFINQKYKGLSYFDVRKIIFVDEKVTEQAKNFIADHEFGETANLFLELKSFLFEEYPFDDTLYSKFDVPLYYSTLTLEQWIKYNSGNGLWYYFENEYPALKEDFYFHKVYSGDQKEIKDYCLLIDQERYKKLDFGPELLANLGTQFTSDIIPKLYRLQLYVEKKLPKIVNYLFFVLCLLISFGIILPLLTKIYSLSPLVDIVSIAMITSICSYIVTSFYGFLINEIKV